MKKRPSITIVKGDDPYIAVTALSQYCRERGWRILSESVTIDIPIEGKALAQFKGDVKSGKVRIQREQPVAKKRTITGDKK